MIFRHATADDIDRVVEIVKHASLRLGKAGIDQWQRGYPNRSSIEQDVENGVGMIRSLVDEFNSALLDVEGDAKRSVSIATGSASYPMMLSLADKLQALCPSLNVNIYEITNNFFGTSITVSGLLTGRDMYDQLKDKPLGEELLIPQNCLRHGEEVFLCGMTVSQLSSALGVSVKATGGDGFELCEAILGRTI